MYVVNVDKGREFKSMHGAYERDRDEREGRRYALIWLGILQALTDINSCA